MAKWLSSMALGTPGGFTGLAGTRGKGFSIRGSQNHTETTRGRDLGASTAGMNLMVERKPRGLEPRFLFSQKDIWSPLEHVATFEAKEGIRDSNPC
jgi:hypothetical protein